MSRSGYTDDCDDNWQMICWRGAVTKAMKGRRGQEFLNEMIAALDALPEKKLIADDLEHEGAVCAIGSVGLARGIDMSKLDPHEPDQVATAFGIAPAMAQEIVYMNDEMGSHRETPETRFARMRAWIKSEIWCWRGCVENPSGKIERYRNFGHWGSHLHYKCVIALNEC